MSNIAPHRPRQSFVARRSFAIVASKYNQEYVNGLVEATRKEIEALSPKSDIRIVEVPGAFEIPVVLQEMAARDEYDALIALGVIIRGETAHADLIGTSITEALQGVALRFRVPVIHEVLLVNSEAQAKARTLGEAQNRGTEAARAAVQMVETMAEVKGKAG